MKKNNSDNKAVTTIKVERTKNYDQFFLMEDNRGVKFIKPELKELMSSHGFLPPCAIWAFEDDDGSLVIFDGQHRYYTAKELGEWLYFIRWPIPEGLDVAKFNSTSKNWSNMDYLERYCQEGMKDYIYLKQFKEEYGLGLSNCIQLLASGYASDGGASCGFKEGKFKVKYKNFAERVAGLVSYGKQYFSHANHAYFVGALAKCARVDDFNDDHFRKKMRTHCGLLEKRADTQSYIEDIERVYNYFCKKVTPIAVYAKAS